MDSFASSSPFRISYYYKENGGVNSAWNVGVTNACGEWFFRCDSDDCLSEHCIEILEYNLKQIENNEEVYGVCGLCCNYDGVIIGSTFSEESSIDFSLNLRFNAKISGEKAGCHRIAILQRYLYPDMADYTKFIFESYLWNRTDRLYKTMFINQVLKKYNTDSSDSITRDLRLQSANYVFSRLFQSYDDIKTIPDYLKQRRFYYSYKIVQLAKWSVVYSKLNKKYDIYDALDSLYSRSVFTFARLIYMVKYR